MNMAKAGKALITMGVYHFERLSKAGMATGAGSQRMWQKAMLDDTGKAGQPYLKDLWQHMRQPTITKAPEAAAPLDHKIKT